jgi:hypothetical protein
MSALRTSTSHRLALAATAEGNGHVRGRPAVGGKFLFDGEAKLYVRGVTYGTFRPVGDGKGHEASLLERGARSEFARAGWWS